MYDLKALRAVEGNITEPRPFLVSAKIQTFTTKRNALRDAIRREGTPAIQQAQDAFESFTDCISMDQQGEAKS